MMGSLSQLISIKQLQLPIQLGSAIQQIQGPARNFIRNIERIYVRSGFEETYS
jgi:hypothetical protein